MRDVIQKKVTQIIDLFIGPAWVVHFNMLRCSDGYCLFAPLFCLTDIIKQTNECDI